MLKNNPYMKAYLNVINESATVNIEKYQSIAKEIGGVYIPESNTIDCKGNIVRFKNYWLNDEGSFDFKLVNTSNDWFYMFNNCYELKYLPEDFTIPDYIIGCVGMFNRCSKLKCLPNNFMLPQNIEYCKYMFYECESLECLPDSFTISNNVINCDYMFFRCVNLCTLPNNFNLSNNVISCMNMFEQCFSLTHLPENFTIPNSVVDCSSMFSECINLKCLPDNFRIPNNTNYGCIFYNCDSLKNKDPEAYKMWEI